MSQTPTHRFSCRTAAHCTSVNCCKACRPLVSTLAGLLMSNCGVIPSDAPSVYGVVNKFLLPLAVPLLLFSADLRCGLPASVSSVQHPLHPLTPVWKEARATSLCMEALHCRFACRRFGGK